MSTPVGVVYAKLGVHGGFVLGTGFKYEGGELGLFQFAVTWKTYWSSMLLPHVQGRVLEVGAGIGNNTLLLTDRARYERWTALEPDGALCEETRKRVALKLKVDVIHGDVGSLNPEELFDSVLYIDVLEHIQDDRAEIERVSKLIRPGGNLVILSPAYQWLYSPFDRAIGHVRRYSERSLNLAVPSSAFSKVFTRNLDSCGIVLSAANRFLLHRPLPKPSDLVFWDRFVVPVSKLLDPLLGYKIGKTIIGVWRRT